MLVDMILERQEGEPYNLKEFRKEVKDYCNTFDYTDVYNALRYSSDEKIKYELCKYIDDEWYGNPLIKNYICSVSWK